MKKNIQKFIRKSLLIIAVFPFYVYAQTFTYTVPGLSNLTVPANVTGITVTAWGAGGGGSKGYSGLKGTGGGGGGYAEAFISVTPGDNITIYVGAGGNGALVYANGSDGENSSVTINSNILTASGGTGGRSTAAPAGIGGTGGTGNFVGSWTSTASYCGGYGANLSAPNSGSPGGGAGGGAGATSNGRNSGGSTSNCSASGGSQSGGNATGNGGQGGDGGTGNSNGTNGTNYGGGGGGNAGSGVGGNGSGGYITISYSVLLPVTLLTFTSETHSDQTRVVWTTINEEKILYYIVEYSQDGISFSSNDTVVASNNAAYHNYSTYYALSRQTYIRLKIIEQSGTFSYSAIIVSKPALNQTSVYPNPLMDDKILTIDSDESGMVTILNAVGSTLSKTYIKKGINNLTLDNLPSGNYFLIVLKDNNTQSSFPIQIY